MSFYDDAKFMFLAGGAAGKDGKVYNIKPEEEVTGSEIIVNGDFEVVGPGTGGLLTTNSYGDYGWNISSGQPVGSTSKITGGVLTIANGSNSGGLAYATTGSGGDRDVFSEDGDYKLVYTITETDGGELRARWSGVNHTLPSSVGTHVVAIDMTTSGSDAIFYFFLNTANKSISIDNVSIKKYGQKPYDFTFTRGTNLTATRVGKDGYIEKGRKNLLLQSNQFDTTWTAISASRTGGKSGYDGSNNAWELKATGDGVTNLARLNQSLSVSGVSTFSVYAKAGNTDFVRINLLTSGSPNCNNYFDVANGSVGSSPSGSVAHSSITAAGNGFYRIALTYDGSAGTVDEVRIQVADADGDDIPATNSYVYIQDAQLEQGLVATDYIETGATTATAGLLEDEPRFDYTGGGCPSLLIEGNAINLIEHTEYFESWTEGQSTVTSNETKSPEGLTNASKLLADANGGLASNHQIDSNAFTIASGAVSASVYAKKGNTDYVRLRLNGTTAETRAWFDLENGEVGSVDETDSDAFGTITDMGDGWYRCTVTEPNNTAATASAAFQIFINEADGDTSWVADGDEYIYLYGAQYEQGSYATSYIPNYGAAATATRTYDDPNDLVHGITMGTSCSFFLEATNFKVTETGGAQTSFLKMRAATSPTESDRFLFLGVANTASTFTLQAQNKESGTPATDTLSKTGLTMGSPFKALARYDGTSFDLFVNGVLEGSAAIVADDHFGRVELKNLTSQTQNGHSISQVILFDYALSTNDSEILTGTSYSSFAAMATSTALNYTLYE